MAPKKELGFPGRQSEGLGLQDTGLRDRLGVFAAFASSITQTF
eukprot:gene39969-4802_t